MICLAMILGYHVAEEGRVQEETQDERVGAGDRELTTHSQHLGISGE